MGFTNIQGHAVYVYAYLWSVSVTYHGVYWTFEKVFSVALVQLLGMLNNLYKITSTVHNHLRLMF